MFTLSKGEPPTPPNTATSPPTAELGLAPCELPQFQKTDIPLRAHSAPMTLASEQQETEIGVPIHDNPANRAQSAPAERDSGFEASPCGLSDRGSGSFNWGFVTETLENDSNLIDLGSSNFNWDFVTETLENDSSLDEVFLDDASSMRLFEQGNASTHLLEREKVSTHSIDEEESVHLFEREASTFLFEEDPSALLLEREDDDDWCPDCGHISSCACSRAESSATVRAAVSSYTDPNTCDSDSSHRSSSPLSPPPSSWSIPATCSHIHHDRLPCPRCNGDDQARSGSDLQNIVASRSYPGSYPASLLHLWSQSSHSSLEIFRRMAAAFSGTSNRSEDRRSSRSRRRQIDSDASSSSSCDENSADELFPTPCEGGSYLEVLATMTEAEELRLSSPEQLPDLVPLTSESSSRRARSQSLSIPLDQECIRQIGSSLRSFSNEFENRFAERNRQPRRSSLTSFLNW